MHVTLCAQFNWDLFPTRWFQNAAHTIIFEGKECIEAQDDSGHVTVQINQLLPHCTLQSAPHRQMLGHLTLETWNHLSFFFLLPSFAADDHPCAFNGY
jgi:hypothetical protein